MKRDWDVIREVLLDVEAIDPSVSGSIYYEIENDDERRTAGHAMLLFKAGFLEGRNHSSDDGQAVRVTGLTWAGHDLLQTIQSKPVWERIKTMAQDKGVELTFEVVKKLSAAAADAVFGG